MNFFVILLPAVMYTAQTTSTSVNNPMGFNFSEMAKHPQSSYYQMLRRYTANNITPISFNYNETIASHPLTWQDQCYTRFYQTQNASLVVYWMDVTTVTMYCEICVQLDVMALSTTPKFPENMLLRIEQLKPRC